MLTGAILCFVCTIDTRASLIQKNLSGYWDGLGTLIQNSEHLIPCEQSEIWINETFNTIEFSDAIFKCRPHSFDFHSLVLELRGTELFLDDQKVGTYDQSCLKFYTGLPGNSWSLNLCKQQDSISYQDRLEALGSTYEIQAQFQRSSVLAKEARK